MKTGLLPLFILFISMSSCDTGEMTLREINWQGHRGARGVYPENTWPAFQYALENNMQTLEMDVVLTSDNKVVLSHEPFLSHEICLDSFGNAIGPEKEGEYNIFRMTYEELQQYDCGSKAHPRFPDQAKLKVTKPLLGDIIGKAEGFKRDSEIYYNIEVKSSPSRDSLYYPSVETYTDHVVNVISRSGIFSRTTLQSFDKRCLRYAHKAYPELDLALLVEDSENYLKEIEELGFEPHIYSCHYSLVSPELVKYCQQQKIDLIPWTVNDLQVARELIEMGVNGIITDYPALKEEISTSSN
ncbi:MAG: glycerophosphodiester phosphodiesterase family protein [Owenweeksia sp.]